MTPAILGLSHLSFSVRDLAAAKWFWVDVMGFELIDGRDEFCFVFERASRLAVVLSDHRGTVSGGFDEHNVGLDHVACAVSDVETLLTWGQRLTGAGVSHSAIAESDGGHHLNLRALDNFPVELSVIKPEFATALGVVGVEPVAATYQ
ncbi:MAG TPA: VOC family protein [Jiangellaceae bacterium]|nr:VOC family protein [Jiangellaceae bacterium]